MDTNENAGLLLKGEVHPIVGAAVEVLNEAGQGLHAKLCEWAIVVEPVLRRIPFRQPPSCDALCKGHRLGLLIPDLTAFGVVNLDAKIID